MPAKKIITVFGATGAQGGGLCRAILSDPDSEFSVRGVTRDVNSDKAKALAKMGAELVTANIDNKEEMRKALEGAYGAYFVTFFWDHFSAERETADAERMAAAAKDAGIQHAIWSTLEDVRKYVPLSDDSMPTLQGKYKVPHFDGKGEGDRFFEESGVPTTYLLASFYWDNFIYFGSGPKPTPDGRYALTLPIGDVKMAGIAAEDIGKCAYGILKKGSSYAGKRIGIAGDHLTGNEMAKALSSALNKDVFYNEVSPEQFRSFGFPGADDLGNMFQFYRDFADECNKTRDLGSSKELNPDLMNLGAWLKKYASSIPLE